MVNEGAQEELSRVYGCYGAMLYRLCMVLLCNREDAEDAVQETFCSYLRAKPVFESGEHEKADSGCDQQKQGPAEILVLEKACRPGRDGKSGSDAGGAGLARGPAAPAG